MAYDTASPPVIISEPLGSGPTVWQYTSTDSAGTIAASGYFSNGAYLGMAAGDVVFLVNSTTGVVITASMLSSTSIGIVNNEVNLVDFGGVGDGITNNFDAITNAMAAANGRKIFVPMDAAGGDYAVTSGALTLTGVFAYETGARIYASGGTVTDNSRSTGFGGELGQGAARFTRGLNVQLTSGNSGSPSITGIMYNYFQVAGDSADITTGGGSKAQAMMVDHTWGGSSCRGGRHAFIGRLIQSSSTASDNTDRNYVGIVGQVISPTGDGGTLGDERGAYFGINTYASLNSGATNVFNLTAGEFDSVANTGSSVAYKTGIQVTCGGTVRGYKKDVGISLYAIGTTSTTWKTGICIGPLSGTADILGTDSTGFSIAQTGSILNAIDITCPVSGNILGYASGSVSIKLSPTSLRLNNSAFGIELGGLTAANSPFFDWHSSGNNIDYDARIAASGGTASIGQGTLTYTAATHSFVGGLKFGSFTSDLTKTIGGYITITDSSGTPRNLLVAA